MESEHQSPQPNKSPSGPWAWSLRV